jgi:hypothetical protein
VPASALTARAAGRKSGGRENEKTRLGVAIAGLPFDHRSGMGLEDGSIVGPIRFETVPVGWGWPAVLAFLGIAH